MHARITACLYTHAIRFLPLQGRADFPLRSSNPRFHRNFSSKRSHPRRSSHICRSQSMTRDGRSYDTAMKALDSIDRLPKMIVFDLDYTLWPFWCEMYTTKDKPNLYEEIRGILDACRQKGIPMAIASRTPTPHVADAFMKKLGITDMFDSIQLIPASSGYDMHSAQKDKAHLPNIRRDTGVEYRDMLFFDDESPNVRKVALLGVTSILVSSGMTCQVFQQGLQEHARRDPR